MRISAWQSSWLAPLLLLAQSVTASAVGPLPFYTVGDAIPVSCLNRTIDTGEHVTNEKGELQYVPFPTCTETGRPLELYFGVEKGMLCTRLLTVIARANVVCIDYNCTIEFVDDNFFHLLEFYVHNDAYVLSLLITSGAECF